MKTLIKIVILLFAFGLQKTLVAQKIQAFALIDTSKIKLVSKQKLIYSLTTAGQTKS